MAKPLAVGDKVLCRLFNTPERKFYGESWVGEILDRSFEGNAVVTANDDGTSNVFIGKDQMRWLVTRDGYAPLPDGGIWLKRKEILRRVK